MSWKPHVVRQGDYLDALAYSVGAQPDTIWDATENKDLKSKRSDPNQLCPGDIIYLPPHAPQSEDLRAQKDNSYSRPVPRVTVELTIETRDREGEVVPVANASCKITGVGDDFELTTDQNGYLAFEVPIYVTRVGVYVKEIHTDYLVKIGHIDDHQTSTGIVHRLANLGYISADGCGDLELRRDYLEVMYPEDDDVGSLDAGLRRFIGELDGAADGEPTADVVVALRERHGS